MQQAKPTLAHIILRFDAPLQRYAGFIVKEKNIAAVLVKDVFELIYDENRFAKPQNELRLQLKNYTLTACRYWLRVQAAPQPQP